MTDNSKSWDDYRLRLLWLAGVGAGGFLLIGLIVFGLALAGMTLSETTANALGFAWLAAFAFGALRFSRFPCPRCRQPFFRARWHGNPLATKCMHCGLPKYQS
jgi:hypothetical protein